MIIDLHAHFTPFEWIGELQRNGAAYGCAVDQDSAGRLLLRLGDGKPTELSPRLSDLAERLRALEERGLERQVLAPVMSIVGYGMEEKHAQALARLFNETNAATARASAGRFIPVATVPMQSSRAAVEELDHAVKNLGIRMVQIGTNVNGANLDEEAFRPFFARAAELGVLVQLHPHQDQVAGKERLRKYYLGNLLGNPIDTAIGAASLMFGGVLERYSDLNVCLVHGGGALPYLLGRLAHGYTHIPAARATRKGPEEYFSRFYFDIVVNNSRALSFLHGLAGPERLVVGTDYPYDHTGEKDPLGALDRVGLAQCGDILGGNAARLLGL